MAWRHASRSLRSQRLQQHATLLNAAAAMGIIVMSFATSPCCYPPKRTRAPSWAHTGTLRSYMPRQLCYTCTGTGTHTPHTHTCTVPVTCHRPAHARQRLPVRAPAPAPPQGSSGLSYSFSVFAPTLKELFGFHETQIAAVGSAMNVGGYLALPSGILFDRLEKHKRLGPKCVVVVVVVVGGRAGWQLYASAAWASPHLAVPSYDIFFAAPTQQWTAAPAYLRIYDL